MIDVHELSVVNGRRRFLVIEMDRELMRRKLIVNGDPYEIANQWRNGDYSNAGLLMSMKEFS